MNHDITLTRDALTLRPLDPEVDASALRGIVDQDTWAGMSSPLPATDAEMTAHLRDLTGKPDLLAFSVLRDGELVGRTCYYDVVGGIRVDIGNTIYGREVWGTMVNPTCKLLLLTHAFEQLEVHRVGMRCDHRNARSHAAIRKLGATFEGTLRCFRPAADGTVADVDYFSVLREEWPQVRAGLEQRLEGWQRPAG